MVIVALALVVLSLVDARSRAEESGPDPRTIEWVCLQAPERVRLLFESLNLDHPGLEPVKAAVAATNYAAACSTLVVYYRHAQTALWLRHGQVSETDSTGAVADPLAPGTFADTVDAGRFDSDLREWILSHPHPGRLMSMGPWRGVDAAARARDWMGAFYGLQTRDEFSPAARILMLSSLVDHAHYLMLFHRHDAGSDILSEMDGLATIGAAWPEFLDAPGWRKYAIEQVVEQLDEQAYPDGTHKNPAGAGQLETTGQFDRVVDVLTRFDEQVPAYLSEGVAGMWTAIAYTMRPDGTTPENDDADRRDVTERLSAAAKAHRRADWRYIASRATEGTRPAAGPSAMFPWAGQLVMRSGWDALAQWALFDVGPSVGAPAHRDRLHLSIDAFGRALLVDAGPSHQGPGPWREYFTGSAAHNVILIDGGGQANERARAREPVRRGQYDTTAPFDFARGIYNAGFSGVRGNAVHTRVVLYVRNEFWVVADRIETDRPRTLDALWHFAPDCHLRIDGRDVLSDDADTGNLRIAPVGGMRWAASVVAGAESPSIQGWHRSADDRQEPAPAAVFRAQLPGTTTFAWVLVPALGDVPPVDARVISSRAERIELRIQTRPEYWFVVTIPMNEWAPVVRREN